MNFAHPGNFKRGFTLGICPASSYVKGNQDKGDILMAGFARLLIIAFVLLTVLYFALYYHLRSNRRDRLLTEFESMGAEAQETKVNQELMTYEGRLRRGLILGVYILPLVVMVATIYFTNFH